MAQQTQGAVTGLGRRPVLLMSRRERARLAKRQAIIETARFHFLTHGYAATSMSEIAEDMGGSKGTLWSHFCSKEALFAAVIEDATSTFQASLEGIFSTSGNLDETLRAFGQQFVERLTSQNGMKLYRLIVGESARFPDIGTIFFDRGPRRLLTRLAEYFGREIAAQRIRAEDPEKLASFYLGMLGWPQQVLLMRSEPSDPVWIAAYVDGAVNLMKRSCLSVTEADSR